MKTTTLDATLRVAGIWTPHGEVLCAACHGGELGARVGTEPCEAPEGDGPAVCDRCEREVWTREDVAACQRVARAAGGRLWQMGGMTCCAGWTLPAVPGAETPHVLVSADGFELVVGLYLADGQDVDHESLATLDGTEAAAALVTALVAGWSRGERYVVETCHDGTDWCVRFATARDYHDDDVVTGYADATASARRLAEGGRFYSFAPSPADAEVAS